MRGSNGANMSPPAASTRATTSAYRASPLIGESAGVLTVTCCGVGSATTDGDGVGETLGATGAGAGSVAGSAAGVVGGVAGGRVAGGAFGPTRS